MTLDNKIPRQNQQFRLEEMEDEHLLYNPLHMKTVYLNPSATLVWRLCDGDRTVQQIIDLLVESYPESKQQIPADVRDSVTQLVNNQALFLT